MSCLKNYASELLCLGSLTLPLPQLAQVFFFFLCAARRISLPSVQLYVCASQKEKKRKKKDMDQCISLHASSPHLDFSQAFFTVHFCNCRCNSMGERDKGNSNSNNRKQTSKQTLVKFKVNDCSALLYFSKTLIPVCTCPFIFLSMTVVRD